MIQLRWIVHEDSDKRHLQYRHSGIVQTGIEIRHTGWSIWKNVPTELITKEDWDKECSGDV